MNISILCNTKNLSDTAFKLLFAMIVVLTFSIVSVVSVYADDNEQPVDDGLPLNKKYNLTIDPRTLLEFNANFGSLEPNDGSKHGGRYISFVTSVHPFRDGVKFGLGLSNYIVSREYSTYSYDYRVTGLYGVVGYSPNDVFFTPFVDVYYGIYNTKLSTVNTTEDSQDRRNKKDMTNNGYGLDAGLKFNFSRNVGLQIGIAKNFLYTEKVKYRDDKGKQRYNREEVGGVATFVGIAASL